MPKHGGYYPDRPFREQILRKLTNDAGDTIAVITRNSYGCLVLNTAQVKLCNTQNCFRARLTPKPWRCGIRGKPERWPFLEAKQEKQFEEWDQKYQARAADWATCELTCRSGSPNVHPEVQGIIHLHDTLTRAESKLQLA